MGNHLCVRKITEKDHLDTITNWMYNWWGKPEGYLYEIVYACMSHSLQVNRLPQTFGLFLDGTLIGMYQFTMGDLFPRPDIYPWLANVYIGHCFWYPLLCFRRWR